MTSHHRPERVAQMVQELLARPQFSIRAAA